MKKIKIIFKIAFSLIKRNKKSNFFIGIFLLLCLTGFITSFSIYQTTNRLFDKYSDLYKSSHELRIINTRNLDINKLKNYLDKDDRIYGYNLDYAYKGIVEINKIDVSVIISEISPNSSINKLKILEGEPKAYPELNEIWIPSGLASKFNISLGDKIYINSIDGKKEYTTSAIVYDVLFSSPLFDPTRMWVRPGQLALLESLQTDKKASLSIRAKNINDYNKIITDLDKNFPESIVILNVSYDTFKRIFNILNNLASYIIFIASFLLLIICSFIIFFIVSSEVMKEYTFYGVYKGLGFKTNHIKHISSIKYFFIILLILPISIILSFVFSRIILNVFENSMGLDYLMPKLFIPTLMGLFIMLIIIIVTNLIANNKLNKIKPANAIRFGYSSSKIIKNNSKIPNKNLLIFFVFKEFKIQKLSNILIILLLSVFSLLFFSAVIFHNSFDDILRTESMIGITQSDIVLQQKNTLFNVESKNVIVQLNDLEFISRVVPIIRIFNNWVFHNDERIGLIGFAFDDYSKYPDLSLKEGRNPINSNEIAISKILSHKLNKNIGDLITINIEGKEAFFLITGYFQIISNNGYGFRLTTEGFKKINSSVDYSWYSILIDEKYDFNKAHEEIYNRYASNFSVETIEKIKESILGMLNKNITVLLITIIFIVSLICGLSIYNMNYLNLLDRKKELGILKSIGFSNNQLIIIQLIKMAILTTLALLIGIIFTTLTLPYLLSVILSGFGIINIENLNYNFINLMLSSLIIYSIIFFSTFLSNKSYKKINLRELIIE